MNRFITYGFQILFTVVAFMITSCQSGYKNDPAQERTKTESTTTQNSNDSISASVYFGKENKPKRVNGRIIMLDTMPPPKVVPAGKPRVVPLKDNKAEAGIPKVVKIPENLNIIIPGEDSVPLPEIFGVQIVFNCEIGKSSSRKCWCMFFKLANTATKRPEPDVSVFAFQY